MYMCFVSFEILDSDVSSNEKRNTDEGADDTESMYQINYIEL